MSDPPVTSASISPARWFWLALGIAVLPQLLVIYFLSQGPSVFVLLVLLWNVVPMAMSAIFFLAGARPAAWGWLIASAAWGLWSVFSVAVSHSSTAALGLLWAPLWGLIILGPFGAGIAILREKRRNARAQQ